MLLESGVLKLELVLVRGSLREIKLPRQIPEGLTLAMLEEARRRLASYELEWGVISAFRAKVWQELRRIPAGQTRTYGQLASSIGLGKDAARAVGAACGANPFLLLIPCHRVVGGVGIGGYRAGLEWKRLLLELEAGI